MDRRLRNYFDVEGIYKKDTLMNDTIHALATPIGGALAIIRISGDNTRALLKSVFSADCESAPRTLKHGFVTDENGETIDEAMCVFMPAPKSYTGEDMAELSIHGGYAVCRAALSRLGETGLSVSAAPGEFTKRAFLNGKLTLTGAEAVMDIINANTGRAARAAEDQLAGALHREIKAIEDGLCAALSGLDAAIDYPEELEEDVESSLPALLNETADRLKALIQNGENAKLLREGARVVIVGKPNAGKSSLLNALLGQDRAIVTDIAGTTRDILQESADFAGMPVRLFDTAGLRESADEVERIGVSRAREAIEKAELLLLALDASEELQETDRALLEETRDKPRIVLLCKSDLPPVLSASALPDGTLTVSALTGEGIEELKRKAASMLFGGESALITNSRHIEALRGALAAVLQAREARDMDCVATDMREALLCLGAITGSAVDASVIEAIFSTFCVGK